MDSVPSYSVARISAVQEERGPRRCRGRPRPASSRRPSATAPCPSPRAALPPPPPVAVPEAVQLLSLFPAGDQQLLLAGCARQLLLLRPAAGGQSDGRLAQLAAAVRQLQLDTTESRLLQLLALFDAGSSYTLHSTHSA